MKVTLYVCVPVLVSWLNSLCRIKNESSLLKNSLLQLSLQHRAHWQQEKVVALYACLTHPFQFPSLRSGRKNILA